jgi:hypothetical protein
MARAGPNTCGHDGFGKWQGALSKNPADVKGIIEKAIKTQR